MGGRIGARMDGLSRADEDVDPAGFETSNLPRGGSANVVEPGNDAAIQQNTDASKVQREPEREPSKDPN